MRYRSENAVLPAVDIGNSELSYGRAGRAGLDEVVSTSETLGALRGVTNTAADISECSCPEMCERDHGNE